MVAVIPGWGPTASPPLAIQHPHPSPAICLGFGFETYSHLFCDCPAAKRLWDFIRPLQDRLHADPEGDQRPARLLGDISSFSTQWRLTAEWNEEAPPPPSRPFYETRARHVDGDQSGGAQSNLGCKV